MRVPLTGRPSNHDEWEVVGKRYLSETRLAIFHQPGDQPQLNVAAHAALAALLDTAEPQVKRLVYLDHPAGRWPTGGWRIMHRRLDVRASIGDIGILGLGVS